MYTPEQQAAINAKVPGIQWINGKPYTTKTTTPEPGEVDYLGNPVEATSELVPASTKPDGFPWWALGAMVAAPAIAAGAGAGIGALSGGGAGAGAGAAAAAPSLGVPVGGAGALSTAGMLAPSAIGIGAPAAGGGLSAALGASTLPGALLPASSISAGAPAAIGASTLPGTLLPASAISTGAPPAAAGGGMWSSLLKMGKNYLTNGGLQEGAEILSGFSQGRQAGRQQDASNLLAQLQAEERSQQQAYENRAKAQKQALLLSILMQGTPNKNISYGALGSGGSQLGGGSLSLPGRAPLSLGPGGNQILEMLMSQATGPAMGTDYSGLVTSSGAGEKAASGAGLTLALLSSLMGSRKKTP